MSFSQQLPFAGIGFFQDENSIVAGKRTREQDGMKNGIFFPGESKEAIILKGMENNVVFLRVKYRDLPINFRIFFFPLADICL